MCFEAENDMKRVIMNGIPLELVCKIKGGDVERV